MNLGSKYGVFFQRKFHLTLTPIWPHVNKNEKTMGKNPIFEISQLFEKKPNQEVQGPWRSA